MRLSKAERQKIMDLKIKLASIREQQELLRERLEKEYNDEEAPDPS